MDIKLHPSWGSHLPLLIKAMNISRGPVLELGTGMFSTPVLHWLCIDQGRKLSSYENFRQYYELIKQFETAAHKVVYVEDWKALDIESTHWGVVFLDHHPKGRRGKEAMRLADRADYIVVHDTDREGNPFHLNEAYPLFKYRYTWDRQSPHSTVLSNFNNLKHFGEVT